MKKLFVIISVIAIPLFMKAQKTVVKEEHEKIGGGKNSALVVMIYEAEESSVLKAWKSLMKDYGGKVSSKDGVFADNATISDMSSNTVDVYATTDKTDKGIKLAVAFDLGGIFVSSSEKSSEYKVAEKIVKNFAIDISKKAVSEKLEKARDIQEDYESELSDLVKKKEKLEKSIEEYKSKIADAEKDIEYNKVDQEKTTKLIETQKVTVEEIQKKLDKID